MRIRTGHVEVPGARLFHRDVGEGTPIVVVHGGPDFDHRYLLPDMDRLADRWRLIYYDQRGRGASRGEVRREDANIARYVEDLEAVRVQLGLESPVVLGHSWGGLLAMHYALRYPRHLSHLVLLNTAPASSADMMLMREERLRRWAPHQQRLSEIMSSREYEEGEPGSVAAFYRIDFGTTFGDPEIAARLNLRWSREEILRGREIEQRLMGGLYDDPDFTLVPRLGGILAPTLVVHGENDFVPLAAVRRIVDAVPGARLAVLPGSGHFSYLDAPQGLIAALGDFLGGDAAESAATQAGAVSCLKP
ncbi:MAG TPA: alpha/beta fold hydrolase [Usitatibacter sp.]|nr:alpha/beta fold hydrolase [Usitatibacter sp.]